MMWLKACPRCRGDLFLDSDAYGKFVSCIQCGHILDKSQEQSLLQVTVRTPKRTAAIVSGMTSPVASKSAA